MVKNIIPFMDLIIPVSLFFGVLFLGLVVRRYLFISLSKWSQKTKTDVDDIIIVGLRGPFIIWTVMLGMYFALNISILPEHGVEIAGKILLVLGILSVTVVLANISRGMIKLLAGKAVLPITSLTQNIARIVIFSIGMLMILNALGISITPILATLGVGGLAVALALQDTLANLFAGFHITFARQVRIGDYIKLESGEEGYVTDINWRTTKIRMLPNNVVLVPNDKMIKAIITNYYLPDPEMAVLVNVGVHYDSDLQKVEQVTVEVAKDILQSVPGGISDFEPFIRYHTFGEFSVNFTVILRAREFVDQYLLKHEFIKRLRERYRKEGIVIPYPIRTIYYDQGQKR